MAAATLMRAPAQSQGLANFDPVQLDSTGEIRE
jgi:hypothetical protein